jgi:cytoskeleton protein RodZ
VQQEVVVAPPMLDSAGTPAAEAPAVPDAAPAAAPLPTVPAATAPAAPVPAPALAKEPVRSPPAAASAPAKALAAPTPAGSGAHRQVKLAFSSESWAEVYDAEGARLFWDLAQPGQSRVLSGVPPFKLILGNPASVSLSYEGKPLPLPPPRFGTTLHATLDGTGALASVR